MLARANGAAIGDRVESRSCQGPICTVIRGGQLTAHPRLYHQLMQVESHIVNHREMLLALRGARWMRSRMFPPRKIGIAGENGGQRRHGWLATIA